MIAVIFEVEAADRDAYCRVAGELRALLDGIEGFISIERFQSLNDESRVLSLSFWRDEAAVKAWRNVEAHRGAQSAGRDGVFRDYRLRVAEVVRDYGMRDRDEAPEDSNSVILGVGEAKSPGSRDRRAQRVAPGSRSRSRAQDDGRR